MIPTILHTIWIGPPMPDWARDNLRLFSELNPDFAVQLHDESVLLPCLEPAYWNIQGEHLYSRRSDLLRVSALIRYGGWYLDSDFLALRPMSDIYRDFAGFPRDCFVTHGDNVADDHDETGPKTRRLIANGVIGAAHDSPFLAMVLCGIIMADLQNDRGWGAFGPRLFTRLVERAPGTVHVGSIDDFYLIRDRDAAIAAYRAIRESGYARETMAEVIGEPFPYMLHMGMQDDTEL